MHFSLAPVILATLASTVFAADTQVKVGSNSILSFDPPSVNASAGDTVTFIFYPKNHTVTQSTFAAPCQQMDGGANSGFQPVTANATNVPSFSITVNNTTPLWFYCMQANHCKSGMVFAINPTANKTFAAFQAAANASSATGSSSNTTTGSGSGSGSGSSTGTATGSAPSSTSSSSKSNGAVTVGARAGGLLAVVGFAAGILL
jgi:plastocyanin